MHKENIILVDKSDNQVGQGEKMAVHREGKLHRAFSIFILNSKRELFLQKRAEEKYHSGGLWTNTCCGHPRAGEDLMAAAHRRLKEEMGFDTDLHEKFSFIYRVELDDLTENEFDHVIVGYYENEPIPNPEEVSDWKWISVEDLKEDIKSNPDDYTYWFKVALDEIDRRGLEF